MRVVDVFRMRFANVLVGLEEDRQGLCDIVAPGPKYRFLMEGPMSSCSPILDVIDIAHIERVYVWRRQHDADRVREGFGGWVRNAHRFHSIHDK